MGIMPKMYDQKIVETTVTFAISKQDWNYG